MRVYIFIIGGCYGLESDERIAVIKSGYYFKVDDGRVLQNLAIKRTFVISAVDYLVSNWQLIRIMSYDHY
jgi:hypothetical protein